MLPRRRIVYRLVPLTLVRKANKTKDRHSKDSPSLGEFDLANIEKAGTSVEITGNTPISLNIQHICFAITTMRYLVSVVSLSHRGDRFASPNLLDVMESHSAVERTHPPTLGAFKAGNGDDLLEADDFGSLVVVILPVRQVSCRLVLHNNVISSIAIEIS